MKRLFCGSIPFALASLALSTTLQAQVGPLLITEYAVTPTAGEMTEIFNPGSEAVDLTDVYISDATFAGGPVYYYDIVDGNPGGGGFGDFSARFPAGASIAPGEYQTIAYADADGAEGFFNTYGELPTYECIGDGGFDNLAVPDMLEAIPGSINGGGGLTNSGEMVVLFYWDGASDLVTDLDYVIWGDANEAVDKTGVAKDGPDADSDTSTYLDDTAVGDQDFMSAHSFGESAQRIMMSEGLEQANGGNGTDGNNESSENWTSTWVHGPYSVNAATAGAVSLVISEAPSGLYDFELAGGTPNGLIVVFFNTSLDTVPFGLCPGDALHMPLAGLISQKGLLDASGDLSVTAHMPGGLSLIIQVADAASCRFSNPVSVTF